MLTHSLPQVDWEQVAKDMNYKSAAVASVRFRQVRKSMESSFESPTSAGSGGEPATPTKGPKTKPGKVAKATPKGRTPKKGVAHPVKGPKGAKSAAMVTKEEDSGLDEMEDDGDDEIAPVAKREASEDESYDMIDYGDEQVST
jgi:hypothetical protein